MQQFKIGVFGSDAGGKSYAKNFMRQNCDIVAAYDTCMDKKDSFLKTVDKGCTWYDTFDAFLKHPMDAVVLTNIFPKHNHYVIRCLEKGIHVFSEFPISNTMAENVALIRAAEKSNSIYMLAENYSQKIFNIEMQRVCRDGTLGKILYAEGEHNCPNCQSNQTTLKRLEKPFPYEPVSYNIAHSLGPIMKATGATPKKVNAFASFPRPSSATPLSSFANNKVIVISTLNDDGSIFNVTDYASYGVQHHSYRICGTEGQIENLRGMRNKIMLRYNEWSTPQDKDVAAFYSPSWNDKDKALLRAGGHDGSFFLTVRLFLDCLRENRQPEHPFDVYSAVTMSSVALLAHRSALENGKTYDIPDFHLEGDRKRYENDTSFPCYSTFDGIPVLPCCTSIYDCAPPKNK